MKVQIITVGDELLIGQVVNTNASWMGEQLSARGATVSRMLTVADTQKAIKEALRTAWRDADMVLITGGLGPTHDDVTRESVASFFDVEMHPSQSIVDSIQARYDKRGIPMPERNLKQALVPEGFEVMHNAVGTAPGLWFEKEQKMLAIVPGVPSEMRYLLEIEVFPRLVSHQKLKAIRHRTLHTVGIGESSLQESLEDLDQWLGDGCSLAYLPANGGVRLRISVEGRDRLTVISRVEAFEEYLRGKLGDFIFGSDADTLESAVGEMLLDRELTVATAESCTGGLIGDRITNVPGSSAYFLGGLITYSNASKISSLGVTEQTLQDDGAVSKNVALQMAHGARNCFGADIGVSSTGIMGPSGGTPDKPVGTVWIACVHDKREVARLLQIQKDRQQNKEYTATSVLNMIRMELLDLF